MTKPRSIAQAAAFTLVELLVGATLSAAIMAAVLSSYIYLARNLGRLTTQQTLETESRRALAYFAQDVQSSTGLATSITPANYKLALTVPTATGSNVVIYYYNSTAATTSTESDTVVIYSTNVAMRRQGLTRCVYNGTTVTSQILLRNITDNNASTTSDLYFRFYDAAGNPYDNGSVPYTTGTTYFSGVKQLTMQFSTQAGTAAAGTRTVVNQVASGRLVMRNRPLLQ